MPVHALRAFSSLHSGSASFCGALFLVCIVCGGSPARPSSDPSGMPGTASSSSTGVQLTDDFDGRRLFPDDTWWNVDISAAPVDAQSSASVDDIGRTRTAHPDSGPPYGIAYVGVGAEPGPSLHPPCFPGLMQTHSLTVADDGSDLYVTGAMDTRWNNSELNPASDPCAVTTSR